MAIAYDAGSVTPSAWTNLGTSYNLSHTVAAGSNLALIVGIYHDETGDNCTGVTYNGTAMTRVTNKARFDGAQMGYIYSLVAPDSGTHNITASFSSSITYGMIAGNSYTGVNQTTVVEASQSDSQASGTATDSVTTLTDNAWIIGIAKGDSMSAGTNTTFRGGFTNTAITSDSNAAMTPTGSYGQSYSDETNWVVIVGSLKPATTGGGTVSAANTTTKMSLLGVGS
jgi:hypothetical protein